MSIPPQHQASSVSKNVIEGVALLSGQFERLLSVTPIAGEDATSSLDGAAIGQGFELCRTWRDQVLFLLAKRLSERQADLVSKAEFDEAVILRNTLQLAVDFSFRFLPNRQIAFFLDLVATTIGRDAVMQAIVPVMVSSVHTQRGAVLAGIEGVSGRHLVEPSFLLAIR